MFYRKSRMITPVNLPNSATQPSSNLNDKMNPSMDKLQQAYEQQMLQSIQTQLMFENVFEDCNS